MCQIMSPAGNSRHRPDGNRKSFGVQGQWVMEALTHGGVRGAFPKARPACAKALWQETHHVPRARVGEVGGR